MFLCVLCVFVWGRVERLGYTVPVFDFRLKGVTSMSADIHKYGLGMKVCTYTYIHSIEMVGVHH